MMRAGVMQPVDRVKQHPVEELGFFFTEFFQSERHTAVPVFR